jgi:chromosome segregation ATPase
MNENKTPMQKAFMEVTAKKLEAQDQKIEEIEKQFNQVSADYKNLGLLIKSLSPKLDEVVQVSKKVNWQMDTLSLQFTVLISFIDQVKKKQKKYRKLKRVLLIVSSVLIFLLGCYVGWRI